VLCDHSDRRNHLSSLFRKLGDAHKAPSSSERGQWTFAIRRANLLAPLQQRQLRNRV
jgi:hypothetical protein